MFWGVTSPQRGPPQRTRRTVAPPPRRGPLAKGGGVGGCLRASALTLELKGSTLAPSSPKRTCRAMQPSTYAQKTERHDKKSVGEIRKNSISRHCSMEPLIPLRRVIAKTSFFSTSQAATSASDATRISSEVNSK